MQRVAWVHLRLFVPPVPRGVCLFEIKQRHTVVQSHVSINAPSQRGDRVRPAASSFVCVSRIAHVYSLLDTAPAATCVNLCSFSTARISSFSARSRFSSNLIETQSDSSGSTRAVVTQASIRRSAACGGDIVMSRLMVSFPYLTRHSSGLLRSRLMTRWAARCHSGAFSRQ